VFILCLLGSDFATGPSLVLGVLPNVLDYETEVKRSVSGMTYVPSRSNKKKPPPNHHWFLHYIEFLCVCVYEGFSTVLTKF
jgi:hypothetical protein